MDSKASASASAAGPRQSKPHWSSAVPRPSKHAKKDEAAADDYEVDMDSFSRDIDKLLSADKNQEGLRGKIMEKLLLEVARGLVATQRAVRELQATSEMFVIKCKASHPAVRPLRAKYGAYLSQVRADPDHSLGGPQLTLMVEIFEMIEATPGKLSPAEVELITTLKHSRLGLG